MQQMYIASAIILGFGLPLVALQATQQSTPPPAVRDSRPTTAPPAKLSGRVTSRETGRPIRRAVVKVSGRELPDGETISTDVNGLWRMDGVKPGRYNILVSKGGYVSMNFGQEAPFEPGISVELRDGKAVENLDVSLTKAGAIVGRVVDEFGEAMVGLRVSALRQRYVDGERRFASAAGVVVTTDDLGQFRIYGLSPGVYVVTTFPEAVSVRTSSRDREGYAQTFYPATLSPLNASKLTLSVGQEINGITLSLTPTRLASISGTAMSSTGAPATSVTLRNTAGSGVAISKSATLRGNGSFELIGIVPGDYWLTADYQVNRNTREDAPIGETGRLAVTVAESDLGGISLTTSHGTSIRGLIRTDVPDLHKLPGGIRLIPVELHRVGFSTIRTRLSPDGAFMLSNVHGPILLRLQGLPAGWRLGSVTVDGRDVTDSGIDPSALTEVQSEVFLTSRSGRLGGTVVDEKGAPAARYTVIVFSTDEAHWRERSRFVKAGRPGQNGRFSIDGLPPGEYLVAAVDYVEAGEETSPEFLTTIRAIATRMTLGDGEPRDVALRISVRP